MSVKRDCSEIDRFACGSKLNLKIYQQNRQLKMTLSQLSWTTYRCHILYSDISCNIHTLLRQNTYGNIPRIAIIWNLWCGKSSLISGHLFTASGKFFTWRRDTDPFVSATKLLESRNEYSHFIHNAGNVRGLGTYVCKTMGIFSSKADELAIGATQGTSSSGTDLFIVLAKVDDTLAPSCYLLVAVDGQNHQYKSTNAGAISSI